MNKRERKKTRPVRAGNLVIGGSAPVSLQSMTNVPLEDTKGTIAQIRSLTQEGAQVIRLAVRSVASAAYLREIRAATDAVLTADVHFNHLIAVESIKAGVDKVRINPGNIGDEAKVREVIKAAKDYGVPIRIGVNSGSIDRTKYPEATSEALVDSALEHVKILEDNDFHEIIVSIKSSNISETIEANEIFSELRDYPLHIGLTEAGYGLDCTINSSVAIGHLLLQGIGDTIRVSMTGDPVNEVIAGRKILEAVGERRPRIRIISCPTCGRTDIEINILELAQETEKALRGRFEKRLEDADMSLTVAVMGCEVNGPGEAADSDYGLAGARGGKLLLFGGGEKLKRIHKDEAVEMLLYEIEENFFKKT